MHKSAMLRMKWFVENYIPKDKVVSVLDVGSYDVNGSYRELLHGYNVQYTGLDVNHGKNVSYVPDDPYSWDGLADNSFDFCISGNAFEHIEYPWLTIKEIYKKLKYGGIACILAPFALGEHKYPLDCYRYYSDGFRALAKWGGFKVIESTVGGIPAGTTNEEWFSPVLNYDDTMMIIAKVDTDDEIKDMPRMGATRLANKWTTV